MGLKATVDTINEIPEAIRSSYVERDGKWHLDVDVPEQSDWNPVVTLRNALHQERSARAEAIRARDAAAREREAIAAEREQYKAKLAELESHRGPDDPAFAQYKAANEARIKALEENVQAERIKRREAEEREAEARFVDEVRREAAPFVSDAPGVLDDFVDRKIRRFFRRTDKGEFVPYDGEAVIYSEKIPGQPMTAKEFIAARAIKDPSAAYMLRQSRGAGAPGGSGTGGVTGTAAQFTLTRAQAKDFDLWQRMTEAARKAGLPGVQIVSE